MKIKLRPATSLLGVLQEFCEPDTTVLQRASIVWLIDVITCDGCGAPMEGANTVEVQCCDHHQATSLATRAVERKHRMLDAYPDGHAGFNDEGGVLCAACHANQEV